MLYLCYIFSNGNWCFELFLKVWGAPYFKEKFEAPVAIGKNITKVQHTFGVIYNTERGFRKDGSQFDHLFEDGEKFSIGNLNCEYIFTPGLA